MAASNEVTLDNQIALWREYVSRRPAVRDADIAELEDHLRNQIGELTDAGLSFDEAFLVAVKRMGNLDQLSREFAREHSDRLWKQLVLTGDATTGADGDSRRDLWVMLVAAAVAALAVKVPALFGFDFVDDGAFYTRNLSLFALPPLAAYFAWRRRIRPAVIGVLALLFAAGAVGANAYPHAGDALGVELAGQPAAQTSVLTAIHLPIALWLVLGVAYAGGEWRSERKRMDFIRFTGEWFIYYVLISLGGGVLVVITFGTFDAIGLDATSLVEDWMLPCGAAGAVVVAGWLVEAKKSVIENIAPVLTRIFTPLFAALLLAFLATAAWTLSGLDVGRDELIFFNVLLVVVLGLLLYAISARDAAQPPRWFEWQQLALVVGALIIDALVLIEIVDRISEWGSTPNRVAALGENVILLVNLVVSTEILIAFLRRREPFARLDRWQTNYLYVFAAWAWTVVLVFPPLFDFA
jgi:hypothetical protein